MDLLGRELEMIMDDRAEDEIHFHNLRNQFLKSTDSRKEERVAIIYCIYRYYNFKKDDILDNFFKCPVMIWRSFILIM